MTAQTICLYPEKVLLEPAKEVDLRREDLPVIVSNMIDSMHAAGGIGLAAPQIGIALRIFVMDLSHDGKSRPEVFINPVIEPVPGSKQKETEGCLSLPGPAEKVTRWEKVKLKAYGLHGDVKETEAEGLMAACFQHECDHLDGKLYISHLSNPKRQKVIKLFRKYQSEPPKTSLSSRF